MPGRRATSASSLARSELTACDRSLPVERELEEVEPNDSVYHEDQRDFVLAEPIIAQEICDCLKHAIHHQHHAKHADAEAPKSARATARKPIPNAKLMGEGFSLRRVLL